MDRRYFRLIDRSGGALGLFSDDFRASYQPEALFARFQTRLQPPGHAVVLQQDDPLRHGGGLPALLQVEDRVSMAVSLESRVPLLDHRLADLVTSMPPAMKFKGGEMKYILKKATQDLVPRASASEGQDGFPGAAAPVGPGPGARLLPRRTAVAAARTRGLLTRSVTQLMRNEAPSVAGYGDC